MALNFIDQTKNMDNDISNKCPLPGEGQRADPPKKYPEVILKSLSDNEINEARMCVKYEYGSIDLQHDNCDGTVTEFTYRGTILAAAPEGDSAAQDCALCISGIKHFVRPATSAEMLEAYAFGKICTHIFIQEIRSGAGLRQFVTCVGRN